MSLFKLSKGNPLPLRVIAITGCDGSGKSMLAASLVNHLASEMKTEFIYLGQSSGRIGEWISGLPLIGSSFGRYLFKKSDNVHEQPSRPPSNVAVLIIFLLSCWRALKFKKMLIKQHHGTLIVTDRYPQAEVAGFRVDGPQLAKVNEGNFWLNLLKKREIALYDWMASYPPALLIRLDIDEKTAHARKPDHKISSLREKISVIPHLTFNGAHIVAFDGTDPADKVLHQSLREIHHIFM